MDSSPTTAHSDEFEEWGECAGYLNILRGSLPTILYRGDYLDYCPDRWLIDGIQPGDLRIGRYFPPAPSSAPPPPTR